MPDRPPSIAAIAALTARLRALSDAGCAADPAELDRFLADKHELLDRITAGEAAGRAVVGGLGDVAAHDEYPDGDRDPYDGYRTYTPATAADQLIAAGIPPDVARGVVDRYLDDLTTARGWEPAEGWEIDDGDLGAMLSRHTSGASRSDLHLRPGQASVNLDSATRAAGEEDDRRAELNRWHADDTAGHDTAARTDEDGAPGEVTW